MSPKITKTLLVTLYIARLLGVRSWQFIRFLCRTTILTYRTARTIWLKIALHNRRLIVGILIGIMIPHILVLTAYGEQVFSGRDLDMQRVGRIQYRIEQDKADYQKAQDELQRAHDDAETSRGWLSSLMASFDAPAQTVAQPVGITDSYTLQEKKTDTVDMDALAAAVSYHETKNCTLGSGVLYNNCFGIRRNGHFVKYATKEDSKKDFINVWTKYYGGLPTQEKAARYSGNDRETIWLSTVLGKYNELTAS